MRAELTEVGTGHAGSYKQLVIENALQGCPLFAGLALRDIVNLAQVAWVKTLAAGERLFYQGDPGRALYVVQAGIIRLYRVNASGHEQVVHIARPRESFAEESVFTEAGHPLNAAAIQSTRLIVLPKNEVFRLLRTCPALLLRLAEALSGHVREMIGLVDDLRLKSARVRLANWLLERCSDRHSSRPESISLSIPKRVVASELGMASETFSRMLAEFQASQLLDVQGRTLTLLCPRQLQLVSEQEESLEERSAA
jgi:CRP/FNR family transcriptional regulator, dissimilatory nitrate respiration regulator